MIYFTIGCLTLIVCGISYIVLVRREFALHYLKDREEKASSSSFEYGENDPMVIYVLYFCVEFLKKNRVVDSHRTRTPSLCT